MDGASDARYAAIYRAVSGRVRTSFFLCLAVTAVMAVITGTGLGLFGEQILPGEPRLVRFLVGFVPAFVLLSVVPAVAQLVYLGREHARAIEAYNVWVLSEAAAYTRATGEKGPGIRNKGGALRWLATGKGIGTRARVRTLIYVGDLRAAAEAINGLPAETVAEAFHREYLIQELSFVARGTMDLAELQAALSEVTDTDERAAALAALAIHEARLAKAAGQPWLPALLSARAEIDQLPRGASIGDRVRATWLVAGLPTLAVIAYLVWTSLPA